MKISQKKKCLILIQMESNLCSYLDIKTKLSYDKYLELDQRVDEIEKNTIYYIDKIEEVLNNLDAFHNNKKSKVTE